MVRLMLTLTPVVCVSAALVVARIYSSYLDPKVPELETFLPEEDASDSALNPSAVNASPVASKTRARKKTGSQQVQIELVTKSKIPSFGSGIFAFDSKFTVVTLMTYFLVLFCLHCTWVTSTAYSSPSVVLASRTPSGEQNIIDDFREAYYWLRQNTAQDAKVMSWWDYGYQLAGFADRTTLVDNATWNNTQCVF